MAQKQNASLAKKAVEYLRSEKNIDVKIRNQADMRFFGVINLFLQNVQAKQMDRQRQSVCARVHIHTYFSQSKFYMMKVVRKYWC
jgi:hypothetical protein